jgi:tryptophanyl-tRNA synthetase
MYPVLMAADILMFKAHKIPVGRDQVQHIEMARDIAQSFNHLYGEHLVLPEAAVDESVALLPGLDGRKMSKSYDNVIGLFAPREQVRKQIFSIVTDSRAPGEPKEVEGSALFQIYQAFASAEETQQLRKAYADGIAWATPSSCCSSASTARSRPCARATSTWSATRQELEEILQAGAAKARAARDAADARAAPGRRPAQPRRACHGGEEGQGQGRAAQLQAVPRSRRQASISSSSMRRAAAAAKRGFASPKEAGQFIAQLKQSASAAPGRRATAPKASTLAEVEAALRTSPSSGN